MRHVMLAALAACGGEVGTIDLELTAAPGSTVLADIQHLRVTITDPPAVVEADRGPNGFDLALDVDATGAAGSLIVEGFDGGGTLLASGASPPFPVAAINARIVVYMAAPLAIGAAPVRLPAARTGVASVPLSFGMVIAGGRDATDAVSTDIFVYNAFDHGLLPGLAMPEARAQQAIAVGSSNSVVLFGGIGPDGVATGTLWRFDTTVAPNGSYTEIADRPELARAGAAAITIGTDHHLITGTPPIDLTFATLTPLDQAPALPATGAAVLANGELVVVLAGDPGMRLRDDTFEPLAVSIEPTATAAALPNGRVVFASPGDPATRDLVVVDAASGAATRLTDALSTPRARAAVVATPRHLVVAGGLDAAGAAVASADVLDAVTLALLATVPCTARAGATAIAFGNDQIAIVGGEPENDLIELFTPPPP